MNKINVFFKRKGFALFSGLILLALSSHHEAYAGTNNATTKATATIASVCTISAQNLSFGALVLPLSSQSAASSMSVLCSNKASYTVGLAYGGIYGQGNVNATLNNYGNSNDNYLIPNSGGMWYCSYSGTVNGQPYTTGAHELNGCPSTIQTQVSTAYAYGKMTGVAKGDTIGYSIQVPGSPGTVWNNGQGSYTATGTGSTQTIPVVGTLVPGQSGSSYPTPDVYMDTVTATVNF
jgi:spore coat protein U-like protein